MKIVSVILILLTGLLACNKTVTLPVQPILPVSGAAEYINYVIRQGEHYSQQTAYVPVHTKSMHFYAIFDSSCMYTNAIAENIYDINKLYGFSDGAEGHQVNSARFGWLWNGKAIELYAYCYVNKARKSQFLETVALGTENDLCISLSPASYVFTFNGKTDSLPRATLPDTIHGYQLFPYFGGDETASHDISIRIKDAL